LDNHNLGILCVTKISFTKGKRKFTCKSWIIKMCYVLPSCSNCKPKKRLDQLQICKWDFCIVKTFREGSVVTPIWKECKDETHTPEMGTWESVGTPKFSEFDCKGQNILHWGVLYIIGKLSKLRCRKWVCMSHLDICNTSYGKNKGRESNWQFDSQPLKVRNRPTQVRVGEVRHTTGKLSMRATTFLQNSSQSEV
jgi:hypothetical protein